MAFIQNLPFVQSELFFGFSLSLINGFFHYFSILLHVMTLILYMGSSNSEGHLRVDWKLVSPPVHNAQIHFSNIIEQICFPDSLCISTGLL